MPDTDLRVPASAEFVEESFETAKGHMAESFAHLKESSARAVRRAHSEHTRRVLASYQRAHTLQLAQRHDCVRSQLRASGVLLDAPSMARQIVATHAHAFTSCARDAVRCRAASRVAHQNTS